MRRLSNIRFDNPNPNPPGAFAYEDDELQMHCVKAWLNSVGENKLAELLENYLFGDYCKYKNAKADLALLLNEVITEND